MPSFSYLRIDLIKKIPLFSLYFLSLLFISCEDDDISFDEGNSGEIPSRLVSYELVGSRSQEQTALVIQLAGFGEVADLVTSGYEIYNVTYTTQYLGEEIIVSGLVSFPDEKSPSPLLSFQNGTNTSYGNAPSRDNTGLFELLAGIASMGYICTVPDYIGFGSTEGLVAPYHHAEIIAQTVKDLIVAAKELAIELEFEFTNNIFLAGYSEGGYAAMATHKNIQESGFDGFNLIASAPASGGYDVKGFQEYYFNQETYANPHYFAFVGLSYQHIYNQNQLISDVFQEPFASEIPKLFDGSLTGFQIDERLTLVVADLIEPDILDNLDTDPRYAYLVDALNENTITNWKPIAPMFMYHGDQDITVPFQNSVDSYNQMLQAGASEENLTLITLEGTNHTTGLIPYLTDMLQRFDQLK